MTENAEARTSPPEWRGLHAYGLPAGSIRALMAFLIFGTLWGYLLVRPEQELPESLRDLLFIILGHYFAVRGRADDGEASGPPPLFLPRGAVRILLIAGFVAVAVVLSRQGRLLTVQKNPGVITLLLVFGFLLGVVAQKVGTWWRGEGRRLPRWLEDTRATVSLGAAVLLALLIWDQFLPFLPPEVRDLQQHVRFGLGHYGLEHVLASVVGFYFGSRS